MNAKFIFSTLFFMEIFPMSVFAQQSNETALNWQKEVMTIGNGVKAAVGADRGDVKTIALKLTNAKCGKSKKDGEDRGRRLSRYYGEFVTATAGMDPEKMHSTGVRLHKTINASKMYQSCWRTIKSMASGAGVAADSASKLASLGGKPT